MDISPPASAADFKICPFCEERRLAFSSLYSARCPTCDYEPGEAVLKTLRQIVALPEATGTSSRTVVPDPKASPSSEGKRRTGR